jgi:hypothetical protein
MSVASSSSSSSISGTIIEADSIAMQHFLDTVITLQEQDPDSIKLLNDEHAAALLQAETTPEKSSSSSSPVVHAINSLVFEVLTRTTTPDDDDSEKRENKFVLAILGAQDRVNVTRLEQAVLEFSDTIETDERGPTIQLAPYHIVEPLSGFSPGTVPPLGFPVAPVVTIVDQSLLVQQQASSSSSSSSSSNNNILLLGGGGRPDHSSLVTLSTLLQQPNVHVADFRKTSPAESATRSKNKKGAVPSSTANGMPVEERLGPKPFFAVAPPDTAIAQVFLRHRQYVANPLKPVWVSVVGRISGVRRMARRLVFLDFAPVTGQHGPDDLPWQSATTGQDMAVQLIAGKTLCQALDDAEGALRRFKVGQLVLVKGQTNMGNRESLGNWVEKRSLDIVVFSYSLLEEVGGSMTFSGDGDAGVPLNVTTSPVSDLAARILAKKQAARAPANPGMPYLRINELYGELDEEKESHVKMVDSMEAVNSFGNDVSQLLLSLTTQQQQQQQQQEQQTENRDGGDSHSDTQVGFGFQAALIGMDCEWKPSFYSASSNDPHPVLLLQICIHPLKQIYLFDMQTLLRPLLQPSEDMNDLEAAVSYALGELFSSKRFIKTGFQVMQDFRRMAASYPHIPSFQIVHGVLEASSLGKKVMHMSKQGNARAAVSSLARFTEHFIGRTLNKEEQVSDWSIRPLTAEQMEYAALDAAVTPAIVEKLIKSVDAKFFSKPQLGRWADDVSFDKFITSWRFLFLETDDAKTIRKLKAKRIIGSSLVVTQFWVSGEEPPTLPSPPTHADGPYTDTDGIVRIPTRMITIQEGDGEIGSILAPLIGQVVGKSKDRCIARLLSGNKGLPKDAKLEYAQRSGYVEFDDSVILFVNMPSKPGMGQRRSYPNEWLEDGQILTWFLRENEWKGGSTSLAHKLTTKEGEKSPAIVLFVRSGKEEFICCGECRIVDLDQKDETRGDPSDAWALVKLHLILTNFSDLQSCYEFREFIHPGRSVMGDERNAPSINGSDDSSFDDEAQNGDSSD